MKTVLFISLAFLALVSAEKSVADKADVKKDAVKEKRNFESPYLPAVSYGSADSLFQPNYYPQVPQLQVPQLQVPQLQVPQFQVPQVQTYSDIQQPVHAYRYINQAVPVSVPQPVPYEVTKTVGVPTPYQVEVAKPYAVPIKVKYPVEIPKPYEVKVQHKVPVAVPERVPVEIPRPYPVFKTKEVKVEIEKPVFIKERIEVRVPVPKPYHVEYPSAVRVKVPHQVLLKEQHIGHQQSVYDVPSHGYGQHEYPTYGSPTYGSHTYGSPTYGSPTYGSPTYGSPTYGSQNVQLEQSGVVSSGLEQAQSGLPEHSSFEQSVQQFFEHPSSDLPHNSQYGQELSGYPESSYHGQSSFDNAEGLPTYAQFQEQHSLTNPSAVLNVENESVSVGSRSGAFDDSADKVSPSSESSNDIFQPEQGSEKKDENSTVASSSTDTL